VVKRFISAHFTHHNIDILIFIVKPGLIFFKAQVKGVLRYSMERHDPCFGEGSEGFNAIDMTCAVSEFIHIMVYGIILFGS